MSFKDGCLGTAFFIFCAAYAVGMLAQTGTYGGGAAGMAAIFAMMAVAIWVTRGERKNTPEGQRNLLVTFAVGITLAVLFFVSSCGGVTLPS